MDAYEKGRDQHWTVVNEEYEVFLKGDLDLSKFLKHMYWRFFNEYMYKVTITIFQLHLNSSSQYNIHVFYTQNSLTSSTHIELSAVTNVVVKLCYEEVLDPS